MWVYLMSLWFRNKSQFNCLQFNIVSNASRIHFVQRGDSRPVIDIELFQAVLVFAEICPQVWLRQPEPGNYKEIIQQSQFQQEFKSKSHIVTIIMTMAPVSVRAVQDKTSKEKLDKTRPLAVLGMV